MTWRNSDKAYGTVAKLFHWLIFLCVVLMVITGFIKDYFPQDLKKELMFIHKSFGVLLLVLTLARCAWALTNPKPILPNNMNNLMRLVARATHFFLYLLLLAMPISGMLMSGYAGYDIPFFNLANIKLPLIVDKILSKFYNEWHYNLAWVLIALISLHILAALKHHFIDKDDILKRMMP